MLQIVLLKYRLAFALLLFTSTFSFAQQTNRDSLVKTEMEHILNYLEAEQVKTTINQKEYRGEWPAYMKMGRYFLLLAMPKKKFRDSNCFTLTGIFNVLAEMYLRDTSLSRIKPMLLMAYPELQSYSTGNRYNFWKLLPPNKRVMQLNKPEVKPLVRRPTTFSLKKRIINNAANVENDADDAASANLSTLYYSKIFTDSVVKPLAGNELFDGYLDQNRKNIHWHNRYYKIPKNTGAYLTWQGKEKEFKRFPLLNNAVHGVFFALPFSIAFPRPFQTYIPWGTNDVDAIVNANILYYQTIKGDAKTGAGYKGAHALIHHIANKERWSKAGHYYPNTYHFHYAVSRVLAAGDSNLHSVANQMLEHITKSQKKDGSFESRKRLNKRDKLQSTTYALQAMLNFKESGINVPKELIDKTLDYLLSVRKTENEKTYWEGGVYFSGGTVIRNTLYFKSDAYTTAIIFQALQKYRILFQK
jgi:hypothetical protein